MTVVYVDSVFVLNTLMDYLLLTATAHLAGVPPRRVRYLLAAALGGAYAVAVFLPGCGFLSRWPVKIAAGILMALASYGGERRLARLTVLLFTVSCGFAGCALGLGLLAGGGIPMNREIPIVADDYVELEFGTGAVKMTPAHDPNDFEVGLRHNLEVIRVIGDDGHINENGGPYVGMRRKLSPRAKPQK